MIIRMITITIINILIMLVQSIQTYASVSSNEKLYGSAGMPSTAIQSASTTPKNATPWKFPVELFPECVEFSPDSTSLAVANFHSPIILVFTVEKDTGNLQKTGTYSTYARRTPTPIFSPNGRLITADTIKGMLKSIEQTNMTKDKAFTPLAFSPDGTLLAVGTLINNVELYTVDQEMNNLKPIPVSWLSVSADEPIVKFSANGAFFAVAETPSNQIGRVSIFRIDKNTKTLTSQGSSVKTGIGLRSIMFLPNSKFLFAIHDEAIITFALNEKNNTLTQEHYTPLGKGNCTLSSALSRDGRFMAIAEDDDEHELSVFTVNQDTGILYHVPGSPFKTEKYTRALDFSPNGHLLAVSNESSNVILYEVDQETGVISHITGDTLRIIREKSNKEMKKALVETKIIDKDTSSIIEQYIIGPKPAQQKTTLESLPPLKKASSTENSSVKQLPALKK